MYEEIVEYLKKTKQTDGNRIFRDLLLDYIDKGYGEADLENDLKQMVSQGIIKYDRIMSSNAGEIKRLKLIE